MTVTGWLSEEELWSRIGQAHIFISASLSDTTPVSLLEAMALGAVPAVSDLPANSQWVVHGLNGALFDPTQPSDIASAVEFLISNPDLMRRAREMNKALVRERANWREDFSRFLDAVRGLPEEPEPLGRPEAWLPWSYLRP